MERTRTPCLKRTCAPYLAEICVVNRLCAIAGNRFPDAAPDVFADCPDSDRLFDHSGDRQTATPDLRYWS